MCILKRLLIFSSLGVVRQLRFCIAPYWVPGKYFPPVGNIAIFQRYFHSYLREVHFRACAVQAVDWRAEHDDAARALSLEKLERSPLPRTSRSLSALGILGIFRPRLGLHRQSCSSVFHSYNFVLSFTAPKSETKEKLMCRWFRFAQLAKGKKFRP